jgi:hypothetical protein
MIRTAIAGSLGKPHHASWFPRTLLWSCGGQHRKRQRRFAHLPVGLR